MINSRDLDDLTHAVFLRRDALSMGYTDPAIRRLVRCGTWHRIRHGAYVDGDLWRSMDAVGRHRLCARAVLRAAHPSAVLSHVSAAIELGAPTWGVDLGQVHVTRIDGRPGRKEAGVVHHRGTLVRDEVTHVGGVPVTTATRAALEVTTIAGVESSLVTVNGLLHRGHTTIESLRLGAVGLRHWPGSLTTRLVLDLADPRVESAAESRAFHLMWRGGIPRPEPQVEIRDEQGHVVARVDFAWARWGVFLEIDGVLKYDGAGLRAILLAEKRREELVCQLTGWVCLRLSWADLACPERTAARITRVLASRRGWVASASRRA